MYTSVVEEFDQHEATLI